jgi:4,5-DOPA dioxygenase extradiol
VNLKDVQGTAEGSSRLNRKSFHKLLAGASLVNLKSIAEESTEKMPVMFVGHGSPMNAILDNDITRGWKTMVTGLKPKAILCISAHWETRGTKVTMMPKPRTLHDFSGFPRELYNVQYPAPGAPELGAGIINRIKTHSVEADHEWGLDHGTWSVIRKMYPDADIPVFQLSLNRNMNPNDHYRQAKELAYLRKKGVLIVGSGNVVHNLGLARWESGEPHEWAVEFDEDVKRLIQEGNHNALIKCEELGRAANLSIPTPEHYLPMLFTLSLQEKGEQVSFFNESIDLGSISMRSFTIK